MVFEPDVACRETIGPDTSNGARAALTSKD